MNLRNFRSWEKQRLAKFRLNGVMVYCVVEWSQHYGDLIKAWQIGNKTQVTSVKNKYADRELTCHACNNLIGEREFERGSIVFEFLYKPLGFIVDESEVPSTGKDGWMKLYSNFAFFKQKVLDAGGEVL